MFFSFRRGKGNNRNFTPEINDITVVINDYNRLRLLENAVINYSGGRKELEVRVCKTEQRMRNVDIVAADVLRDVAVYLHDIAIAGDLSEPTLSSRQERP